MNSIYRKSIHNNVLISSSTYPIKMGRDFLELKTQLTSDKAKKETECGSRNEKKKITQYFLLAVLRRSNEAIVSMLDVSVLVKAHLAEHGTHKAALRRTNYIVISLGHGHMIEGNHIV